MPFVRVTMMPRSQEIKRALAKDLAAAIMKHCNVTPDHTWIVFDEPSKEQWSFGGELVSDRKPS